MTLQELKQEVEKYQYLEDTNIIDVALASVIATRLKLGDPIWLVIIGASSGGKSQILRPISLTDSAFLHRIDDLTENTFLSGMKMGKGSGESSLLLRIGSLGMIVISDLTVLFSKSSESRQSILSQFRMIYDGEMIKHSGTSDKALTWKGYLGVIAGSTPSIYANFEEVADMGERFIYYRMKDYDPEKATRLAMSRKIYGKDLDDKLASLYAQYIKDTVLSYSGGDIVLPQTIMDRILQISMFAEKIRTVAHTDFYKTIDRIPVSAMPMRVSLQLISMAKGLSIMRNGDLGENDLAIIDWCGYSLANEEKRACLKILASVSYNDYLSTQNIADRIGLSTTVVGTILQNLSAVDVLVRTGSDKGLMWAIKHESHWGIIRRVEKIDTIDRLETREITNEENKKDDGSSDDNFDKIKW